MYVTQFVEQKCIDFKIKLSCILINKIEKIDVIMNDIHVLTNDN